MAVVASPLAQAEDVLIRHRQGAVSDPAADYHGLVLAEVMRRTEKKYGPYRSEIYVAPLARERLLVEMLAGEQANLAVVATQPNWEEQLLPIRIPIDFGLSGYRFSLIHRDNQAMIASIKSDALLRQLSVVTGPGWASRKVFEAAGFDVRTADSRETLIRLLMSKRAELFPRSFKEAEEELQQFGGDNPGLAIEQSQVLYFPLPTYVFVSPRAPRLAARIEAGLEAMLRDGSLLRLMKTFHADMIARANFCQRRVFHLPNPQLTAATPLSRKALWFDPLDPATGVCRKPGARR